MQGYGTWDIGYGHRDRRQDMRIQDTGLQDIGYRIQDRYRIQDDYMIIDMYDMVIYMVYHGGHRVGLQDMVITGHRITDTGYKGIQDGRTYDRITGYDYRMHDYRIQDTGWLNRYSDYRIPVTGLRQGDYRIGGYRHGD
jgi:hypothetical protein